jgi:GTP-binding protein
LVDATGDHAGTAYRTIRRELEAYGEGLAEKAEIVVLSKVDAVDEEMLKAQRERLKRAMRSYGPPVEAGARRKLMEMSAVSGQGVRDVLRAALAEMDRTREREKAA